jgi:hypothetical protein
MAVAIYFLLFLILVSKRRKAICYLSADLQSVELFEPRTPLSETARRAGGGQLEFDADTGNLYRTA